MTSITFKSLIAGVLIFSSCTTMKPLTSSVRPTEVNDIQKFETFSYITLIEEGNRGKLNDSLSTKSKTVLRKALNAFPSLPLTESVTITDTNILKRIEKEVGYLCVSAYRQRNISNLKLTKVLDSLLDTRGKRFGLITVTTGFTRAKGNYVGQIAKGVAMGILTLGMYYQTPIKANSTVYAMIIDATENNIAFFRKVSLQDKEPLDQDVLTKQIQKIFDGYFWTNK